MATGSSTAASRRRRGPGWYAFATLIALVVAATVALYLAQPPWGSASASRIAEDQLPSQAPTPDTAATPSSPPTTDPESLQTPQASPIPSPAPDPTYPPDQVDNSWPQRPPWDACSAPVWPDRPSEGFPGDGRRVLILGDSLTRDSQKPMTRYLEESGWTPTFRCWGSKRLDWGLDQITRAKKLDQLPEFVVVALGTNDVSWVQPAVTEQRANKLLDRLGPKRQVLWVDLDVDYSTFSSTRADWFNKMIREVARERPNVTVVPWESIARKAKARRFDGIHYLPDGYKLRARELTDALNQRARRIAAQSWTIGTTYVYESSDLQRASYRERRLT